MDDVVHICVFAALDDLKPKQHKDRVAVLRVLDQAKRFSVFEVTSSRALALTMDKLIADKLVTTTRLSFPWLAVELTDAGRALLVEGGTP